LSLCLQRDAYQTHATDNGPLTTDSFFYGDDEDEEGRAARRVEEGG
jgi:hypothetical protein